VRGMAVDPVDRLRFRLRVLQRISVRYPIIILLLTVLLPVLRSRSIGGVLLFGPESVWSWVLVVWTTGVVVVTLTVWRRSLAIEPLVREGKYAAARELTRPVVPVSLVFGLLVGVVLYLTDRQLGVLTGDSSAR
jgi:hypothetical protein